LLVIEIKLTLEDDNMYINIQPLGKFDGIKIPLGEKLQWLLLLESWTILLIEFPQLCMWFSTTTFALNWRHFITKLHMYLWRTNKEHLPW